jgi:uncharacterized protein
MKFLEELAKIQYDHAAKIALIAIIITLIISVGMLNIRMQTDFNKEMPQDLDVIELQNSVKEKFGGNDVVLVLIQLDKEKYYSNSPTDIRDPEVVNSLISLEDLIYEDNKVTSIQSVGTVFNQIGFVPNTTAGISQILSNIEQTSALFNKDYSATMMIVSVDLKQEKDIEEFIKDLKEKIDAVNKPSGVKISITGNPPIRSTMMKLLQEDLYFTTILAAFLIFILILIFKRSLSEAILIFTPMIFGLIWMLGLMGWQDIPLSITTVGVSAMILGLGTEYGIFLLERFQEERKKGLHVKESMIIALPSVGSGIIGSGTTTIAGFLALMATTLPMIQNLGKILALGITCILIATIVVAPVFVILEERIANKIIKIFKKQKFEAENE